MGIAEDIKRDYVASQQELSKPFETVEDVKALFSSETKSLPNHISLRMCVLSKEAFKDGWSFLLIDKILSKQIDTIAPQLLGMDFERQSKYVFRLTVWQRGKRSNGDISIDEMKAGTEIVAGRVTGLMLFKNKQAQGNTNKILRCEANATCTSQAPVVIKQEKREKLDGEPKKSKIDQTDTNAACANQAPLDSELQQKYLGDGDQKKHKIVRSDSNTASIDHTLKNEEKRQADTEQKKPTKKSKKN